MNYFELQESVYGRDNIFALLKKRVIDLKEGYRHNIALIGSQYVGKSTILQRFTSELDEENVAVIYLDLEHKDFYCFYSKFIGSLLYHYSKQNHLPLHNDLDLLMESTKNHIPQSIKVIHKIRDNYKKNKMTDVYLGLLTLPEVFANETNRCCVLIFDEFQNLENFSIPDIFQVLGKKIMTQTKCLYILASSYEYQAKKILSEKLSLLFGSFEDIHVNSFKPQISQRFIELNLKPMKIGSQLRNLLTDFTGGHPLYLNLICREIRNLCAVFKQNEVYMPILSLAVENTIFDRWGVISRHFDLVVHELCLGKGNQVNANILIGLANGKTRSEDLIKYVEIKKTQLSQRLQRLVELCILSRNGKAFFYKDKLFKYWIRYIFQRRLKDIELSPDKQKQEFKDEFTQYTNKFTASSDQEFSSRIIELLQCIENNRFNLNGRKYRFPSFNEIVPFRLKNERGIYIDVAKARTENETWFIVMKEDIVCENDIVTIMNEAKRGNKKPKRCLIVSLADLDENARLKALQERYWIWNQCDINELLSLFDKPYILK